MEIQDDLGTNTTEWVSGETADHQQLPRGTTLGRYVIIEPIGAGGMGAIYRAYDPELNRGVALKILSVKQVDKQAAQRAKTRLVREAQALAQLSHPNVVAVHDVGSFGDDVFIAMELVEGKTLKEWLEEDQKPTPDILQVMAAAGRGLSAAHQAGLVHRDFKPGNVIVGNDGRVRVLDFGLARAVSQAENLEDSSDGCVQAGQAQSPEQNHELDQMEISSGVTPNLLASPLTRAGGVVGTPMYMAPEQHLGRKTDERTDLFSFCVVLYEALYGHRPFVAKTLAQLKDKVTNQQLSEPTSDTKVPAWLWQIMRKGLCAKPADRYQSLASLLEELSQDPDQLRRQQQRGRRRKLLVAVLIVLTLVAPMGVWYGLRYRTVQRCKNAQAELAGVWDEATKNSVKVAFLETNKSFAQGSWERVEKNITRYLTSWANMRSQVCEARLLRATQSEELFDLRMRCLRKRASELGALVGVFVKADTQVLQKAVQASSSLTEIAICADEEKLRSPYPPPKTQAAQAKVAQVRQRLTEVQALQKTGKYQAGLTQVKTLQSMAEATNYLPVQAEVLYWLGELLFSAGEYKQSEAALYRAARAAGEGKNVKLATKAMASLVWVVGYSQSRHKEGLTIARDTEILLGLLGRDDDVYAQLLNNQGVVRWSQRAYPQALKNFQKSLALRMASLGPDHPDVALSLNNLGLVYQEQGKYQEALQNYRKASKTLDKMLGSTHPGLAKSMNNMGIVLSLVGDFDNALEKFQQALTIWENALGPDHPEVAESLNNMGSVLRMQGEYARALQSHQRALTIRKKSLGSEHPHVAVSLNNLAGVYQEQHNYKMALEYFRQSLVLMEKVLGPEHPYVASPLSGMGLILVEQGQHKAARKPLERVVHLCEKKKCDPGPHAHSLFGLSKALLVHGKNQPDAIQLARRALDLYNKTPKRFQQERLGVESWLNQVSRNLAAVTQ